MSANDLHALVRDCETRPDSFVDDGEGNNATFRKKGDVSGSR